MRFLKYNRCLSLLMLLWILCVTGALTGCGKKNADATPGMGEYEIYYLNQSVTKLVSERYDTDTTDTDTLIEELMGEFRTIPPQLDCQTALTDKVVYLNHKREEKVLYLYFDTNYSGMKPTREILCRAALTKTLTQVPGIEYINIYSGDQPLMDSKGMPVGMLAAGDFIDSISDVNSYEKSTLTLYFTDETGEKLWPETRTVMHNVNTSLEKLLVDELIGGPEQAGLHPTLPKELKLLNISVNDNVCYVNFDATFQTGALDVKEYIPIYSLVNSLSELSTVNRVQITVNGAQDVMFRDLISLNTMFERNLDYIGGQ